MGTIKNHDDVCMYIWVLRGGGGGANDLPAGVGCCSIALCGEAKVQRSLGQAIERR